MPKGKNYSVYLSADTDQRFEKVKAHVGKGISETIALLIDIKANEIDEGVTRRQTMTLVQESLTRLESMLAKLMEERHVNY